MSPSGPYIWRGPADHKWIALTFDEDMRPSMYRVRDQIRWYDPRIIQLLESTGTHATIFVNGLFAVAYPTVLRELAADPNLELANHSWDHQGWTSHCSPYDLPIKRPMTKTSEVVKTARAVRRLTGVRIRYFRFPAGCHSSADVALVRSLGEIPIGWGCTFGDALGYSVAQQVRNVQQTCGRGSIVVTHLDGPPYHDGVFEALSQLLPWWRAHGWRIVSVGTMLGHPTPRPPVSSQHRPLRPPKGSHQGDRPGTWPRPSVGRRRSRVRRTAPPVGCCPDALRPADEAGEPFAPSH